MKAYEGVSMRNLIRSFPARTAFVLVLSAFIALGLPAAQANTIVSSVPAIGAVLSIAPNAVSVTAATTLLADGNSLAVTNSKGTQVDDGSLTISDTTAVVGLKPLTATGIYTVSYTLLSATDTPLTGSYTFLFNAPAIISTPSSAPTSTTSSVTTPQHTTSNGAANVAVLVFVGLATVVALFLIWYARLIWIQSRRARKRSSHDRSPK
jgi:methionine-rich copper-binding protein CopC